MRSYSGWLLGWFGPGPNAHVEAVEALKLEEDALAVSTSLGWDTLANAVKSIFSTLIFLVVSGS